MDSRKLRQVAWKLGVVNCLVFVFLLGNLVIRFCTIFYYPPYNAHIAGFFGVIVSCCIFVVLFPKYLKVFLFIFGFSFFLFGFGSIDIQSRVFELIVTCVATALFVINWRAGKDRDRVSGVGGQKGEQRQGISRPSTICQSYGAGKKAQKAQKLKKEKDLMTAKRRRETEDTPVEHPHLPSSVATGQAVQGGRLNRPLVVLILCYVGLSLFSLLLLPVRQIVKDLWFFGFPDSFYYLFIGPPSGFYYPVAAIIRLMLFVVLAFTLSITINRREIFKFLFSGIFSGAVFCAFIGLLDFYGVISLVPYRFGTASTGVLHSTFGNRGWFGEFILTVIPFVLVGFMSKIKGAWWKILLFGSLVICEVSLILSGGRAGWVSYPPILFICWLFFHFSKEGRLDSFKFRWKDLVKVAVSVPITIVLSFLLIFYFFMPLSGYLKSASSGKGSPMDPTAQAKYIKSRASKLIVPHKGGRLYTWGEGYNVGKENPVYGMGYESFFWHANILSQAADSYYNKFYTKLKIIHQTPHNVFFSIFASGGIIGVCLWLLLAGYAVVILSFDLVRNKRLLNTPVIISIISFHIFGIFQSMQYIPMIWLLIFLCLGYAMTIDEGVLPVRVRRVMGVLTKVSVVLVVIGLFVYLSNFESRSLAEKYGLKIYAMDQERDRFAGFFQHSKRWNYGDYRWSGKRGSVVVSGQRSVVGDQKGEDGGRRAIELEFDCRTPRVEKDPVVLTVFHDGKLFDKITFTSQKSEVRSPKSKGGEMMEYTVRRKYELPEIAGKEQKLLLEVSRTWIPHEHLRNFDRRKLGVGVKIVKMEGRRGTTEKRIED